MEQYYQIGAAARLAGLSVEALRHYDRVGLVIPSKTDSETGYRYYSDHQIAQLEIVRFLRSISLSLPEIKAMLSHTELSATLNTLQFAEKKVEEEIARLLQIRQHLQATLQNYSTKKDINAAKSSECTEMWLPGRTVLLAEGLGEPSLRNLLRFHDTVEEQIPPEDRGQFQFENAAGVLIQGGRSHLFASCIRHGHHPNLVSLPTGRYLCHVCTEANREDTLKQLHDLAAQHHDVDETLVVIDLVFTGIIQWNYDIKLYLGGAASGK